MICENSKQSQLQRTKRETKKSKKVQSGNAEDNIWEEFETELELETVSLKALNKG